MIPQLKKWLKAVKLLPHVELELQFTKQKLEQREKELLQFTTLKANPVFVVNKIFSKDLSWFDYDELPNIADKVAYYEAAQQILRSNVFLNEYNHLVATGAKAALLDSLSNQGLRDFQMTINGMELLMQRLQSIKDPRSHTTNKDPHAGL